MIPRECKRLAEVDFPIAEVSRHAAREKSIRHGHPSTLHLWWARRPLASCRAMLLALLLPDPCDAACPAEFKERAWRALEGLPGGNGSSDAELRQALLTFIGDFANWDLAANSVYLEAGRALVTAAHPEERPLVVDPFAGGGSIPLEALRLGCEAFASDLNPVACLILKVMLEDIPRHGPKLAEELRRAGAEIKQAAECELGEFYPPDPDDARPIAYLWARTVRCERPNCGAEIPLARSFWLCKKANRRRALRPVVVREGDVHGLAARGPQAGKPVPPAAGSGVSRLTAGGVEPGRVPLVEFEIFAPESEAQVPAGTVSRAKATCLACRTVLPPERVRAQLAEQRGGADVIFDERGRRAGGARLLAVVTLHARAPGRHYRPPEERDYEAVGKAARRLEQVAARPLPNGLSPVPDEPTPLGGGSGAGRAFSVRIYGMLRWGDLFTARQKLALVELDSSARSCSPSPAASAALALAVSRCAEQSSSLVRWRTTVEAVAGTFGRQALPMMWDFAEILPMGEDGSNFAAAVEWVSEVVEDSRAASGGQARLGDAMSEILPTEATPLWFTDPPYYDAVPYADLSDFFFVWLKRVLPHHPLLRDPFEATNPLTPKALEIVQDETKQAEGKPKDRAFFERAMAKAFVEGRRVLTDDGVGCVVFAHKTTEGWEALLSGMIQAGWVITASWPVATERPGRLRSQNSAALATSVHLVCRPRTTHEIGDWREVLRELPVRVGDWMGRLQGEGVRGADLVFACIGPALEIFSRYARVETAEGREVPLAEYLEKVWEVVGRAALEQVLGTPEATAGNGGAGALEEDARLTALFLWTLQATVAGTAVSRDALTPPSPGGRGGRTEGGGADAPGGRGGRMEGGEDDGVDEDETAGDGSGETARRKKPGFSLVFDVVRRFAQPLGIHLPEWERRIIETEKGVVRLLPVRERVKQLFGEDGASGAADQIERQPHGPLQLGLFGEAFETRVGVRGRRGGRPHPSLSQRERGTEPRVTRVRQPPTTLDRVHAAMLLQAGGQTSALRSLLGGEQERGPDFLRLANALSALYPRGSEEKRLLDAMLLAAPR